MNYEDFKKLMIEEITKKAKIDYPGQTIELGKMNKTNDVVKDSITLRGESDIAPTLYLNDMFLDYNDVRNINEIVEHFFDISISKKGTLDFDPAEMMKWENIKDRIVFSIVVLECL